MSAGFSAPPSFTSPPLSPPPRKSGMSWLVSLLLIGLGILTLGGAVCIGGVWYIASNIDRWVVGLGREAIVAVINDSELPQDEKTETITQVDRIVTAYKERKINQSDLEHVLNELQDSPAFAALTLYGVENDYLTGTDLTAEEVENGRRTFQRALRAVYEGKVKVDDFYAALPGDEDDTMPGDSVNSPGGTDQVRLASNKSAEPSSDDDLRLTLTKLRLMADTAGIPDEPFQIKVSEEVKKLVDGALQGK